MKELDDSDANPTPYLDACGLAGDPRLGITYAWISSASRTRETQSRMPRRATNARGRSMSSAVAWSARITERSERDPARSRSSSEGVEH